MQPYQGNTSVDPYSFPAVKVKLRLTSASAVSPSRGLTPKTGCVSGLDDGWAGVEMEESDQSARIKGRVIGPSSQSLIFSRVFIKMMHLAMLRVRDGNGFEAGEEPGKGNGGT